MAVDTLPLDFGRDKPFYVYVYRDPRPSKRKQPIYVGKGTAAHSRADSHWLYGTRNPILKRMLHKIRAAKLEPIIEIVAWFDNEEDALVVEEMFMRNFGRRNKGEGPLANMTDGGDGGGHGRIWTDDQRKQWAEMTKARWRDPEYAATMSEMSRKLWRNEVFRDKRMNKMRETYARPEIKAAISDGIRKSWKQPSVARKKWLVEMLAIAHSPTVRAKVDAFLKSDEYRESKRSEMIEKWKDEEFRSKVADGMAAVHSNPIEKERKRQASKRTWAVKATKIVAANKAAWADPEKRARRITAMRAALRGKKPNV